VLRKLFST